MAKKKSDRKDLFCLAKSEVGGEYFIVLDGDIFKNITDEDSQKLGMVSELIKKVLNKYI